tara:strand:+ start:94 stop:447 length:354 start_codon:yes stop_codon:yes gene_type:complete
MPLKKFFHYGTSCLRTKYFICREVFLKALVTGSAGFIGSYLVDVLLSRHYEVIGLDNLSTGVIRYLEDSSKNSSYKHYEDDILDLKFLTSIMKDVDIVYDMAVNADIRGGTKKPYLS